ncbi:CDP-diacylglycerol--serine O-phosphatidyltransferase [Pelistega indica]|uniref:CDP-diacylglycerol--serine O-phosphatidyltransferase n=1 Tax=Pelistega indica TaxID=1414851 RepID=V8G6P4_9BURK|nr:MULTISPECIES: CDP-diacylglycerol--serine O-phosphatidyltransferase [Pelistega]ETD72209.1 CDP-diacylglycerol--serine O-phosphatidyltransferase [Pelistega indica]
MTQKPHRGFYLLPNAFTTGNLFAGVFAIMLAMNGRFELASTAIFVAMLLDGMDGRVARLTNTQSAFGEQYDSMADMVSFGVAPAMVMYAFMLDNLGRLGLIATFIYVAGAALRLARFNTNINVVDSRFFQGLPSPSAAALLSGFVWLSAENRLPETDFMHWIAVFLTIYAGLTMISTAPFFSGKSILKRNDVSVEGKKKPPAWLLLALVLTFAIIALDPAIMLFLLFVIYALSGWVIYYFRWKKARELVDIRHKEDISHDQEE